MYGEIYLSNHIFYGVFATTISLFTAAEIYFRAQPIISVISIISARKNKGIVVSSSEMINKVPNEVWEMIKLELVPLARSDFCKEMLIKIRCAECAESCTRMYGCGAVKQSNQFSHQISSWQDCIESHNCQKCFDSHDSEISHYVGNDRNDGLYGRTRIESFLNKFNFNFVSRYSFSDYANSRSDDDPLPVHILVPLQPFSLSASPESIASRFAKLVNDWKLDLKDPNKKSCGLLQGNLTHHNGISLDVEKDKEYYETPQWYLWSRASD